MSTCHSDEFLCPKCSDPEPYICDSCNTTICIECDESPIEDIAQCDNKDCYYCQQGRCFNNYIVARYCQKCAPQELLDEIENNIHLSQTLSVQCDDRRTQLVKDLRNAGLELRNDSKLCSMYIDGSLGDEWSISDIVRRMSEMKYLFEYCDIRSVMKTIEEEYIETLEAGYFPDTPVFNMAEYVVMTKIGQYPDKWPWLKV